MVLTAVLFSIPIGPVSAGVLEELNSTYIIDVSGLPTYRESELRPDVQMTTAGHLQGWVDIVGFQKTANISGMLYIHEDPAASAVVRGNARIHLPPPGIFPELTQSISVRQAGIYTVATLHASLKWYLVSCDDDGCWISGSDTEEQDWTDTEISPQQFVYPGPPNMTVEQFPGIHPVNLIHFSELDDSIIFFSITTPNGSVEHLLNIGMVEHTSKGIPYMNVTPFSVWRKTGKGIYHQGDDPIMDDGTIESVFLWTPFGKAPDYNFSEYAVYRQNKPTSIDPSIGFIIYVVIVFLSGIYVMYRGSGFR